MKRKWETTKGGYVLKSHAGTWLREKGESAEGVVRITFTNLFSQAQVFETVKRAEAVQRRLKDEGYTCKVVRVMGGYGHGNGI